MKSIIVYYSQSGNTKKIAQAVQQGVAGRSVRCDIARLKEISPDEFETYDLIGLGSPVWSCLPTPNLLAFIKSFPASLKGKHAFYFCTHGTLPGRCMLTGVRLLQHQGLLVVGWHDWYGGVFLAGHAKPYFTDGHPDAIDVSEAETFGSAVAETSLKILQGAVGLIPVMPEGAEYDEAYAVYPLPGDSAARVNGRPAGPPLPLRGQLRINAQKCTGCMLCAENCVSNNIDSSVSPPVFKSKDCARCLYCEGICPAGAVEYDFAPPEANFEAQRRLQKVLAFAEANGRFRRLVAEQDIGWYTPWEKVTGHPRLKVP